MSLSVRYFHLPEDGGIRLVSRRLVDGVANQTDKIPEFSASTVRMAEVTVESERGRPVAILSVRGTFWSFDDEGAYLADRDAILSSHFFSRRKLDKSGPVVDIRSELERRRWEAKHRWTPSVDDIELIRLAIWPQAGTDVPAVESVKGSAPKRPPMTYEGREARTAISQAHFSIMMAIEHLSEPALKGLAYDLREAARHDLEYRALKIGAAEEVGRLREVRARHRTGRGIWYAVIDVLEWDEAKHEGRSIKSVTERCNGKKAAIERSRVLLAENAHLFGERTTVEASVMCDLEFRPGDGA